MTGFVAVDVQATVSDARPPGKARRLHNTDGGYTIRTAATQYGRRPHDTDGRYTMRMECTRER